MSESWLELVRNKVMQSCTKFMADPKAVIGLLDEDNMQVWVRAFTHFSHHPDDCYENAEYIGDRICEWAFKAYVMRRFPNQTVLVYTYLTNVYMDRLFQSKVARQMGLDVLMRGTFPNGLTPFSVCGDVFESFMGALFLTGGVFKFNLCYKFISWVMDGELVDLTKALEGPSITLIDQMFTRMQINTPKVSREVDPTSKMVKLTMSLNKQQLHALSEHGIIIPNHIIASSQKRYHKPAEKSLYIEAYEMFKSCGFTHHWTKKWKSDCELDTPQLRPWKQSVQDYVQHNNYMYIYRVPTQICADEPYNMIRVFAVKNDELNSTIQVFSTWAQVDKKLSGLYVYAKMFPAVSTDESRELIEDVDATPPESEPHGPVFVSNLAWERSVQSTLCAVIKTFTDNNILCKTLTNAEAMASWKVAFTDETCAGRVNNHALVHLGHKVLIASLSFNQLKIFPDESPGVYTNLTNFVIEDARLAKLSRHLKLNQVLRCGNPSANMNQYFMRSVLESFVGCLSQVGGHLGPALCFKFVSTHFPMSVYSPICVAKIGSPESYIDLIFKTLDVQKPLVEELALCTRKPEDDPPSKKLRLFGNKVALSVKMHPLAIKGLAKYGLTVKVKAGLVLSSVEGVVSKKLMVSLHRQAIVALNSSGVTVNTAKYIKYLKNLSRLPMSKYARQIGHFTKEHNIRMICLHMIDKVNTRSQKYTALLGILNTSKRIILAQTWCSTSVDNRTVMEKLVKQMLCIN